MELDPVIEAGATGTERTVVDRTALVPQAFDATTEITPLVYAAGRVRFRVGVPWPELRMKPIGTLQV